MKKFYIFFASLFLLAIQLKAQAPNSLSYQGVARNTTGLVLPNQGIGLRFSIHQGSAGGTIVYQETQSATTNLLGLFTVAIGNGTPTIGTFAGIGWSANTEYLQVEMDPTALGGTTYLDMGTNQYLSVPYALSAGSTSSGWNLTGNSSTGGTDYVGTTDANDLIFKAHSNEVMRVSNTNNNVGIGTNNPNAGAELDISSSTQGLLIPRMASNPTSPSQGMMYFNTSTGCFMYYTGTVWNAMVCPCPNNPAAPGAISGPSSNVCPSTAGVIYSVAGVSNANSYNWTVPAGTIITAGQGSNVITVTTGTTSGNVTVAAVNNCGTGATTTQAIAVLSSPITVQPSNAAVSCATPGNATFTVTTTGGGLTYQWMVSTNGGTSYSNVPNSAPYSNPTTATLTITSPSTAFNGYLYKCAVISGSCTFTSNPATLFAGLSSVPVTLTNGQSATTTSSGLQVMVTINSNSFKTNGEDANLDNVEFTSGPGGTGTAYYAWLESVSTASPSNTSTASVYWVNLGATTITNGTPKVIYMTFTPTPVMTSPTSITGMAPQLSTTYAQYDNGALVFSNVYTAYGGLSGGVPPAGLTFSNTGGTLTNNPTNTVMTVSGFVDQLYYTSMPASATGATVIETYASLYGAYLWWGVGEGSADGNNPGLCFSFDAGANGSQYIVKPSSDAQLNTTLAAPSNTPSVWSLVSSSTSTLTAILNNYVSISSSVPWGMNTAGSTEFGFFGTPQNGTTGGSNNSCTIYWTRTRIFPPNGVLPTVAVGSYGCN